MDYTYRERHGEAIYRFKDGMLPSDFFRRNVVLSFQEDAIGIRLRDVIGVDNMMWGSEDLDIIPEAARHEIVRKAHVMYLNFGAERAWLACDAPAHTWVRDTWRELAADPRLTGGGRLAGGAP